MAESRIGNLRRSLEELSRGLYDLHGSREELALGLTQFLSRLGLERGEQYLTVSLPSMWFSRNLGYNGRVLSMNKHVARRGAAVRRVFLVTPEELSAQGVVAVIQAHQRVIEELDGDRVRAETWDSPGGGYWAGFVVLDAGERDELIRRRRHFGLVISGNESMWVFPVYRPDGQIVSLHFRSSDSEEAELRSFQGDLFRSAKPISEYGWSPDMSPAQGGLNPSPTNT